MADQRRAKAKVHAAREGAGAARAQQRGCWSRLQFLDSQSFLSGDGIVFQPIVSREHGNLVRFGTSAVIGRLGAWRRRAMAERRTSQLRDTISNEQFVNRIATHEKVAATTVVPYEAPTLLALKNLAAITVPSPSLNPRLDY